MANIAEEATPELIGWQQGDLILQPLAFPVSAVDEDGEFIEEFEAPHGAMIISQTCDIVRFAEQRPFVQLAPIVPVEPHELAMIRKKMKPQNIVVPGLGDEQLAVDLDACWTVRKELVQGLNRINGCPTDHDQRQLGRALGRFRSRFAFPDEFVRMLSPLKKWIEGKRNSASEQGKMVKAIDHVRAVCDDWATPDSLILNFMLDVEPTPTERDQWTHYLDERVRKLDHALFIEPEIALLTFDDISAREFLNSHEIDWEGLSERPSSAGNQ